MSCRTSWLQSARRLNDGDRRTMDRGCDKRHRFPCPSHFNIQFEYAPLAQHWQRHILIWFSKWSKSVDAHVPTHILAHQLRRSHPCPNRSLSRWRSMSGHKDDSHVLTSDSE